MNVFVDANVVIAVLNREYPLYTYASQVLSLADDARYTLFVSPLTIAIAFYFASKKSGAKAAKQKIGLLLKHVSVASMDQNMVVASVQSAGVKDLEDGLQYHSALGAGCEVIVTEDQHDFHFSKLPVMRAAEFLAMRAKLG